MNKKAVRGQEMYENLFYSIVGCHAGENIKEIIERKQKEILASGISLWSAKIDKMSKKIVWQLSESAEVTVLCKFSKSAKDPVVGNPYFARKYVYAKSEVNVPSGVFCSFEKGRDYQAYVIKEYEVLESPMSFDFGKYDSQNSKGEVVPFADRFKTTYFQNVYGKRNGSSLAVCEKEISLIMKLQYPFVVDVK